MEGKDALGYEGDTGEPLSDALIKRLISVDKLLDNPRCASYREPEPGKKVEVPLHSAENPRISFALGLFQGIRSSKVTLDFDSTRKVSMHTRRASHTLVRVDLGEVRHTNPDGQVIDGPHIHIATEEYGDRMAYPLSEQNILVISGGVMTPMAVFEAFREYCHIDGRLMVEWSLGV